MAISMKGRHVDMNSLMQANRHVRAVGNASMNAGGDIIGAGGKVLKTRAQLDDEIVAYFRENPLAAGQAPLNSLETEVFTPSQAVESVKPPVLAAEPIEAKFAPSAKSRKLSDSE